MARYLRTLLPSRPQPFSHWQQIKSDKATAALAAGTIVIAAAVVVAQYSRLLNRRTHSTDPDEYHNAIANPEHAPLVKRLHAMLDKEFGPQVRVPTGESKGTTQEK